MSKPIVIIGAGISGLTLAILFKKLNKKVIVIEKRSPYQDSDAEDPRSFNLTITERGMKSFREIGIETHVLDRVVPLQSRVVHHPSSCICSQKSVVQSYGVTPSDKIFSIRRSDLINVIYEEVKKNPNVELLFDCELMEVDKAQSRITYCSRKTGEKTNVDYELLIGADGAYSKVRNFLLMGEIADLRINYFSWIYKKFVISAAEGKLLELDPHSLHVFPHKGALCVSIPNLDGSFSSIYCTDSKELPDLKSEEAHNRIESKFLKDFPHLFHLSEKLRNTLRKSKVSGLVDVHLSKWTYEDRVVLVGDAAHAVFPFYGQGMNCALQDCRLLVSLLTSKKPIAEALAEYETTQRRSTTALSELCRAHFYYLQEKSFSPLCQAQRILDRLIAKIRLFPWHLEYNLVAQTELPYHQVTKILKKQEKIRKILGFVLIDYMLASCILVGRRFSSFYSALIRC